MKTHVLKTWCDYFDVVAFGLKPFEVRLNDRSFKMGDTVVLQRWNPASKEYERLIPEHGVPISELRFRIGFVLHGGQFGIEEGYCVFSLLPME